MLELTDAMASFEWSIEELAQLHVRFNRERELELVRSLEPAARSPGPLPSNDVHEIRAAS